MEKKKKIIISLIAVIILICGLTGLYLKSANPKLTLKNETVNVEYGEAYSFDLSKEINEYQDLDKDKIKEIKVSDNFKYDDNNYLEIGSYTVKIKYKKQDLKVKVIVKDTIKPEFKDFKEQIYIEANAENVNLADYFKAYDMINKEEIDAKIDCDSSAYNINTPGSYKVKISATDNHNNTNDKYCNVEIVSLNDHDITVLTPTIYGNVPVSASTKASIESGAIKFDLATIGSGNNLEKIKEIVKEEVKVEVKEEVKEENTSFVSGTDYGWMPLSPTCICIDLSHQVMVGYINGEKIVETPIVSGWMNVSDTPTGNYSIINKVTNTWLTGPTWHDFVEYWMAFRYDGYGIHDSSWRSEYGGSIYQSGGSHGCVNTPINAMRTIYNSFGVGTLVFVR